MSCAETKCIYMWICNVKNSVSLSSPVFCSTAWIFTITIGNYFYT